MKMHQMADGTWATSPMYMGIGLKTPCNQDEHAWETKGSPSPIPEDAERPEGMTHMNFQVCKKCSYQRVLLSKEKQ